MTSPNIRTQPNTLVIRSTGETLAQEAMRLRKQQPLEVQFA